jgi:NADPH:quinone reductase-like Zn-dependent oxidoreductase
MASQFWDEKRAERCSQFRYEFPVDSVRQKTVVVAGGSGGLGAATVALQARQFFPVIRRGSCSMT